MPFLFSCVSMFSSMVYTEICLFNASLHKTCCQFTLTMCCHFCAQSNVGRSDEVVAAEALANHTRCNNSFIYNLFQALYRSSLTCPSCHHHSNTFDPFLSLSLPIPHQEFHVVNVVVVRHSEIPGVMPRSVMMSFATDSDDSVFDLRRMISDGMEIARDAVSFSDIA